MSNFKLIVNKNKNKKKLIFVPISRLFDTKTKFYHLRYAHYCVCIYLSVLFNFCVSHGFIPEDCLITDIVFILKCKNKDATNVGKYRPIAVATTISKLFEQFISFHIKPFLSTSDHQFGFKRGTGTDMCIFLLKQIISSYLQRGSPIFSVFLDASKAFDRVSHELLFKKLLLRDVPPCFIQFLQYWYCQQQMRVRWGSQLSQSFGVSNGVRQGEYLVLTYLLSISINCQKISIMFLLIVVLKILWLTISYMQMMYAVSVLALQEYKIYLMCVIAFLIKMVGLLFLIVINLSLCSFSLNHFTSRMSL